MVLLSGLALLMPHEFPITAHVMIPLMLLIKANSLFNRLILHNISHSGKFSSFFLIFNANAVVASNRVMMFIVYFIPSPHSHIKLFQTLRFTGLQPFCIIHSHSSTLSSDKNVIPFLKSQQLLWLHVQGAVYASDEQI